ncbi:hypothetical protein ACMZOO_07980 [Catenovulum sp. SX2]|uniref:hypothetical protein n=1 Tax=Catenovulum sp. SX2 TaxID=3398614 RepID=UPI003F8592EB
MALLYVYFFGLVIVLPFAISFHYLLAEKFSFAETALFKSVVYGIACAPCAVELGEGHHNKAFALALYAIWQDYGVKNAVVWILGTVSVLFIYFLFAKMKQSN